MIPALPTVTVARPARDRRTGLLLLLMACAIGYQLLVPPIVGLANNGDYERMMGRLGLQFTSQAYEAKYFRYVNQRFSVEEPWWDSGAISSQYLLLWTVLAVNRMATGGRHLDVRVVGAANAACFLVFVWLAIRAGGRLRLAGRSLLVGLVALIFTDVGYVAYFNSIYTEPASLVFLAATLAASLSVIASDRPRAHLLVLYFAAAALFVSAKAQNGVLGWVLAAWGVRLSWRWPGVSIRLGGVVLAVILVGFSHYYLNSTPAYIHTANLYNAVFSGILRYSRTPEADLIALGLDPGLSRYANTNAHEPIAPMHDPEFGRLFFERINHGRIAWYYVTHPRRMVEVMRTLSRTAFSIRPEGLGNFTQDSGYPPGAQSRAFALWSTVKARWPGTLGFLAGLLAALFAGAVWAWARASDPSRRLLAELFVVLLLTAVMQYGVKFLGNGLVDNVKQLFLFNVLLDVSIVFAAAAVIGAVLARIGFALDTPSRRTLD
jgi:hypothetical protein